MIEALIAQVKQAGKLMERISGSTDVVIASVSLPLIVLTFKNDDTLVPIEIRKDKDTLGWLYTQPSTAWIAITHAQDESALVILRMNDFKRKIEELVKQSGKKESDEPHPAYLLRGEDGSVTTYVVSENFFNLKN